MSTAGLMCAIALILLTSLAAPARDLRFGLKAAKRMGYVGIVMSFRGSTSTTDGSA